MQRTGQEARLLCLNFRTQCEKAFGLERGEVDLTADRTKKKKNVRSDIKKRDLTLARKEREQKRIDEKQRQENKRLEKERDDQNKREEAFLKEKSAFRQEKSDFAEEIETASQKAV